MKTIKSILSLTVAFVIGVYAVPMYNNAVIERNNQRQEMVQQQKMFKKAVRDSQRSFIGLTFVRAKDFINKF